MVYTKLIRVENTNYGKSYNLISISNVVGNASYFFRGLDLLAIPLVLSNLFNKNYRVPEHRLSFYKGPEFEERFDEPNLDIKEDEIQIRVGEETWGLEICKTSLFYYMALDMAHKALEAVTWFDLFEKGIVDKKWVNDIKQWIIDNEDNILKMQEDNNENV